ncbi:sensor histidine kinase [Limosilactobacillus kribbianus]|uniref:sensor histidine kinase n=1 Tax=Limosilactobacillus kribbianus TaxID=2982695 RepID=UPI0022643B0A|nr:sensor histidine kinase [Limosilactobacillus kribbianus]
MFYLSILMIERVGFIVMLAFLLVNIPAFRRLLFADSWLVKVQLTFIFAIFALIANFTGIEIDPSNQLHNKIILTTIAPDYSIVNARILAVSVAGIIGGPWVGGSVGLIAGMHRVILGGMAPEAWFYVPSSVLIGLLSGYLYNDRRNPMTVMTPWHGFLVGLIMETIQMIFIFLFSPTGWTLVHYIALPMILINSIGTSIFLSIIAMYLRQEEDTRATQTHSVLQLTKETLPFLRNGLNMTSAQQVVEAIMHHTNFDAVSITDRQTILAHVGAGSDHHIPGKMMLTHLSETVIRSGQVHVARTREEIGCTHQDCPLEAAIVVPLRIKDRVIGTLKMYYTQSWRLTPVEIQLGTGLGEIFANQIALGQAEVQAKLVRDAEIKSLQAQVNPHFFFNAINTISAMMRIDAEKARQLLLQLSTYFRSNLVGARATQITLAQEREQVNAYLSLEQTRFPGRYLVNFNSEVDDNVLLPPFTIQVLVENALKHAFGKRRHGNVVNVNLKQKGDRLLIAVADNGTGIDPNILVKLGQTAVPSAHGTGTALQNLNQRLIGLYDKSSQLDFATGKNGTTVTISIPLTTKGESQS